jgi:Rps23 Pro-64 3,4-dihydroxylase Tpa1-like proline 4-hydroxylase
MRDITLEWERAVKQIPFRYFYSHSGLRDDECERILSWLENEAPWKRVTTYFYEQYEFHLQDANLKDDLKFLIEDDFISNLRKYIETYFPSFGLSSKVDVVAHKLTDGDTIGIHNDYIENCETHRILFNFNRGWTEDNGGFFMVFSENNPEALTDLILAQHGHVHGFEISPHSHHAVSKVNQGDRYNIIYSFYKRTS